MNNDGGKPPKFLHLNGPLFLFRDKKTSPGQRSKLGPWETSYLIRGKKEKNGEKRIFHKKFSVLYRIVVVNKKIK